MGQRDRRESVDHRRASEHHGHHGERLAAAGEGEDRAERAQRAERTGGEAPDRSADVPLSLVAQRSEEQERQDDGDRRREHRA